MHFFEHFYVKRLKYDLLNKFFYLNNQKFPKIKKIILNFSCKTAEMKNLASSSLALELITNKKGRLTNTRYPDVLLKIRKGNPTGCKIILRKELMYNFLGRINYEIFPRIKNFAAFEINKKTHKNVFSFSLQDNFLFYELEQHYHLFNYLSKLNITIVTNAKNKTELAFMLKSFHFPLFYELKQTK
jgi:large subunit ribosomal protein L5